MTPQEQHQGTAEMVKSITAMVMMIPAGALNELQSAYSRYDAIGPIIDPTEYMRNAKSEQLDARIVAAVAQLRAELERIKSDAEARR